MIKLLETNIPEDTVSKDNAPNKYFNSIICVPKDTTFKDQHLEYNYSKDKYI